MKKFIFAIALFMLPSVANATPAELCPTIGQLAGKVMQARQLGIPKDQVLAIVLPGTSHDLTISLINLAYASPVYPIDRMRQTAIENFRIQAEYLCYENASN